MSLKTAVVVNTTYAIFNLATGVEVIDPFDLPAPPQIPQATLPPVAPSRAVIPSPAAAITGPRYWGPEIQAEIDRRFEARVRNALKDEVTSQVDLRMDMLNEAIQSRIDELDRAIDRSKRAEEILLEEANRINQQVEECQSALCTPSRRRSRR
jgi:hypothetical protein